MKGVLVTWGLMALALVVIGYLWGQAQFELPAIEPSQSNEPDWTLPKAWDSDPATQAAKRLFTRFGQPTSASDQGKGKGEGMVTQWQLRGMLHEPPNNYVLIEQGGQIVRKKVGDSLPNGENLLQIDSEGILIETLDGAVRVELYPTP